MAFFVAAHALGALECNEVPLQDRLSLVSPFSGEPDKRLAIETELEDGVLTDKVVVGVGDDLV